MNLLFPSQCILPSVSCLQWHPSSRSHTEIKVELEVKMIPGILTWLALLNCFLSPARAMAWKTDSGWKGYHRNKSPDSASKNSHCALCATRETERRRRERHAFERELELHSAALILFWPFTSCPLPRQLLYSLSLSLCLVLPFYSSYDHVTNSNVIWDSC